MTPHLISLAEWQGLTPYEQGFVLYMQASWPGSELEGLQNPHAPGSRAHAEFKRGEQRSVLVAQDSEE